MGIYIKGIKIPPTCRYCAFRHLSISENAFCTAAHETIDYMAERTKRLDNCPLVELLPHGRLIDADALLKELEPTEDDANNGAKLLLEVFNEVIKSAPTIIEAETCNKLQDSCNKAEDDAVNASIESEG